MSRALALKPDQEDEIWRLWLQRIPQGEIATTIGCSRTTVSNAVNRIRTRLNEHRLAEIEELRTEALAEYDVIKREAWTRLEQCAATSTAAVGYLGVIADARKAQDRLLGLEQITINHRGIHLARIEAILTSAVPLTLPGAEREEAAHG